LPHVVLNGEIDFEALFNKIKPLSIINGNVILKTKETYIEKNKKDILIDSLAIEDNKKTSFLSLVSSRDDGVVIRLYPNMSVEKTNGVKQILAELAMQFLHANPELKLGKTNLQDYLK